MKMNPHPRLYVTAKQLHRLRRPIGHALLQPAAQAVVTAADSYLGSADFDYPRDTHNAHLVRARLAQTRIVTLLVRYFQTGQRRYRAAALAHVDAIGDWEYWSWIMWRKKNPDPTAIFDLSYGENCATLAIAYDWLHGELTPAERARFLAIARKRAFRSFLHHTQPAAKPGQAWWFKHTQSNWNTVCAGGAGMLALALHDVAPESAEILRRANESIAVFFGSLHQSHGAWPEGIGYWNYGMRYGFMFLLSHENATGKPHPVLRHPATKATLQFPLDFCPNGVPCSFGDVNQWQPLPVHYAVAQRLRAPAILAALAAQSAPTARRKETWPSAAELLLLHPHRETKPPAPHRQVSRLYRGQDWGFLADRWPAPRFYVAVRGGASDLPHGHRDLLSFHAVVADEALIPNLSVGEYLDTTFSERRFEIFETMPASKNTLLINGVGIAAKTFAPATRLPTGIRLDATTAMGAMRDGPAAKFCGRLFLLISDAGVLIVDRIELPHVGRVEARFHTFAKVKLGSAQAELAGQRQRLGMTFASDVPATLHHATTAPTTPGQSATVLRWCADNLQTTVTFATWLRPGGGLGKLKLDTGAGKIVVTVGKRRVVLSERLNLKV
ncbi:MAG: hypothetical protein PCFJNLEI_02121 [Verrucomicrobiae bacterium]|nr:hypothetical protein [Verrucomicrobiae bacterium]